MSLERIFHKFYMSTMLSFANGGSSSSVPDDDSCKNGCCNPDDCCPPGECYPPDGGPLSAGPSFGVSDGPSFALSANKGAVTPSNIMASALPTAAGLPGGSATVALPSGGVRMQLSNPSRAGGSGGGAGGRGEGVHLTCADYSSDDATAFGFDVNVNWGGSITEHPDGIVYLYRAYGKLVTSTGSTTNPFRWIGSLGYFYNADLLHYYVRARHYYPHFARWLSEDPRRHEARIVNLLIVTDSGGHLLGVTQNGKRAMIHQEPRKEVDHGQRIGWGLVWEHSYHLFADWGRGISADYR